MFYLVFTRPVATLLAIVGVSVLAPVIFPLVGTILKPIVKPLTNLYLDISDEMADTLLEREKRKGVIKPESGSAKLKKRMEESAEVKAKSALEGAAARVLVEEI